MDGWNTIVSYWGGLFSGALAVSFREGNQIVWLLETSIKKFKSPTSLPVSAGAALPQPGGQGQKSAVHISKSGMMVFQLSIFRGELAVSLGECTQKTCFLLATMGKRMDLDVSKFPKFCKVLCNYLKFQEIHVFLKKGLMYFNWATISVQDFFSFHRHVWEFSQ